MSNDAMTTTALYLVDADTGCVAQGPVSYDPNDVHHHAREIAAHSYVFPHRRFVVAPHPRDDGDYQWTLDFAARHGLPDRARWAQVTTRLGAPASELFTNEEQRRGCTGQPFCGTKPLRLVLWTLRDARTYHGEPHHWWRRVVCNEHLDGVLERLIDRCLHDYGPDAARHIGVLVPGDEEAAS